MATDKKEYRREYMRWYMAKRRKTAAEPPKVARKALAADFVGPPCPANLPDRSTDGRNYTGQIALLKVQLAHTIQLWREASEDLLLQIEMLQMENEALQRDQPEALLEVQKPQNEPPKNLPAPSKEPPKPDLDQYMLDKAQGFVDPDRKPTGADDEINF